MRARLDEFEGNAPGGGAVAVERAVVAQAQFKVFGNRQGQRLQQAAMQRRRAFQRPGEGEGCRIRRTHRGGGLHTQPCQRFGGIGEGLHTTYFWAIYLPLRGSCTLKVCSF